MFICALFVFGLCFVWISSDKLLSGNTVVKSGTIDIPQRFNCHLNQESGFTLVYYGKADCGICLHDMHVLDDTFSKIDTSSKIFNPPIYILKTDNLERSKMLLNGYTPYSRGENCVHWDTTDLFYRANNKLIKNASMALIVDENNNIIHHSTTPLSDEFLTLLSDSNLTTRQK